MATAVFTIYDDGTVILPSGGNIRNPDDIEYPAGSIVNADISASAAIAATKCEKAPVWVVNQEGVAVDRTFQTFIKGAGQLTMFTVWCGTAPTGAKTVTVDLQVGGVSVLDSVVTLDSSSSANTEYTGTISSATLADGSRLSVVIDETSSGTTQDAEDVGARVDWDEAYATT
jgi:hypothetical protein